MKPHVETGEKASSEKGEYPQMQKKKKGEEKEIISSFEFLC